MKLLSLCLLALSLAATLPVSVNAQDDDMKARFRERKPQLDALKAAGAVAENDQGFVVCVKKGDKKAESLVDAENADRSLLYESIAKATGSNSKTVGQRRAKQIKEKGAASP